MLIAYGWTLTTQNYFDPEIFCVVTSIIGVFHLMIAVLTIIDKDEKHKYHDYGGVQGFLIVLARIGLFAGFLIGLCKTKQHLSKKQHGFLRGLGVSGTLYMMSFPLFYILSYIVEPVL